jgi:endonuclease-3
VSARSERAGHLLDLLAAEHPDAHIALDYTTPLELLVATILSAQCTDARVNMVTPALFALCRTPADYLALPQAELEELIRPTGFFRNKARAIRECCASIEERFDGRVPETLDELVTLHGVGRKTAAVVSSNAFGRRDGIAVDTHTDPVKVERALMRLFPRERWLQVSDVLIFHGRRVCEARRPRCAECAVRDLCPSAHLFL